MTDTFSPYARPSSTSMVECDPTTSPDWMAFARQHGSLFASPPWLRAVSSAFMMPVSARLIHRDGRPVLGLPIATIDDPGGFRRSTMPFCDFSDLLVGTGVEPDWSIIADLSHDPHPYSIRWRTAPGTTPEHVGLVAGPQFGWHRIDTVRDTETIWAGLDSNARQGIRKAQREGVSVAVETGFAAIDEFRRLHVDTRRRKYGMLAQPPEFFDAIAQEFSDDAVVVSARLDGHLVAGILVIRWGDTAYYKFNASDPRGTKVHANDLCMWKAIELAQQWNLRWLDLGLSDLDQPGLVRYKEKYATEQGTLTTFSNLAARQGSTQARFRRVINDVAAAVLADGAPDDVSVSVSSTLYRYFC